MEGELRAVGISGSTSARSRSRLLVERTLVHLLRCDADTAMIDLSALPADALLARRTDVRVDEAIALATGAQILVVGTPVYRATYTGQLKAFFDLFPRDSLTGLVAGLIVTGYGNGHRLSVDHGLRPLIASLGGLSAARSVYVTDAQIPDLTTIPEPIDVETRDLAIELCRLAVARTPTAPALVRQ
jgi:FMN reductase